MTEPGSGVVKRRTKKLPAVTSEGATYCPKGRPVVGERSPYPMRAADYHSKETSDQGAEFGSESESEDMSRKGEDSELATLLKYMMERDAEEKAFRREQEEARREQEREDRQRLREEEAARRREEEELRAKIREDEEARRREDEERRLRIRNEDELARGREDDERRRLLRREDETLREKRELLQEKLRGLGVYKDGNELRAYLEKFERIMRESGIDEGNWAERVYPRLPESLCMRVSQERDGEVAYGEIKKVLLKAAGETAITYGNQLFEATSEQFKSMSAGGIVDWVRRTVNGLCQGCKGPEECMLAVAMAFLRKVLPQSGKAFLEMRKISEWGEMRDAVEDWMSGRQRGNFFRPLGGGYSESGRVFRGHSAGGDSSARGNGDRERTGSTSGVVTCFSCGERGHRSTECKKGVKTGGSGYVPRPPTCYNCGKVGHRSTECTVRKTTVPIKKEVTPTKMSMLTSEKTGKSGNVAFGDVNGVRTEVLIDSGAELGSVPKALVPKGAEMCKDIRVRGYGGAERDCKSFMGEFVVGGYRKVVRTIIDEGEPSEVACIVPFAVVNEDEAKAYRMAIKEYAESTKANMGVITRSRAAVEAALDVNDGEAIYSEWSCIPERGDDTSEPLQDASSQPEPLMTPEVCSKVGEGHGVVDAEGTPEADEPQAKAREGGM